jgi:hypothetical protein
MIYIVSIVKIKIITPSYRIDDVKKNQSINFEYIYEWIIVYDENKKESKPFVFEENEKIKEYIFQCDCIEGIGQRNYGLTKITNLDTLLYYLDADNIIHPDLYNLLDFIDNNTIYSFDQYNRIKGNNINVGYIDTAMAIIPFNLYKNIKWKLDVYEADGYHIKECYDNNEDKHLYIDQDLYYYNF